MSQILPFVPELIAFMGIFLMAVLVSLQKKENNGG